MERLAVEENQRSPITESYRKIAMNIEFSNIDNNIKTIMVTSTLAGEGKTTTICNVVSVMAELKGSILLIDLDLRKPSVHKKFNISNDRGLTDLLLKKDDYTNYINNVSAGLDVITSGRIPTNPSEIINSKAIKDLLKELSNNYDYIFIDAPPIGLVSDPMVIATFCDGVFLTIAHSETEINMTKKSVNSLKQVNANIIGIILNKVPISKNNKYYYSYY